MVVGLMLMLAGATAAGAAPGDTVIKLSLDGVVDPFSAGYLTSQIDEAEQQGVAAILVTIDTPGGLDSAMRQIVQRILAAEVPVICYVSPKGARAASAGTFILLACPVAAMAPGTNVGAAHPVGIRGAIASDKATNDAAAYIRSLAEDKGRNADWAERAVHASESVSASRALELNAIDLVVSSEQALLQQVDGRQVTVGGGKQVNLTTAGATVEGRELGALARLLHRLFSPNLAFLFFFLGLGLIAVEIVVPGLSVPGVLGAVLLVIALAAFGMLPVQLIGLVLLAASVALFAVEIQSPGLGLPAIAGMAALVAGGLLLFDPAVPGSRVSLSVIAPVAIGFGLFFFVVVRKALDARRLPPSTKSQSALGAIGYATTALAPSGVVQVGAETWSADATAPVIEGQKVKVVGVEGLRLRVEPVKDAPQDKREE
ncbi:MAG: NfeD family protein [Actinomycetota bacterium]